MSPAAYYIPCGAASAKVVGILSYLDRVGCESKFGISAIKSGKWILES